MIIFLTDSQSSLPNDYKKWMIRDRDCEPAVLVLDLRTEQGQQVSFINAFNISYVIRR